MRAVLAQLDSTEVCSFRLDVEQELKFMSKASMSQSLWSWVCGCTACKIWDPPARGYMWRPIGQGAAGLRVPCTKRVPGAFVCGPVTHMCSTTGEAQKPLEKVCPSK